MATVKEIESCFNDCRTDLGAMIDEQVKEITDDKARGDAAKAKEISNIRKFWRIAQMGLFIAESFIVDHKRIANALDGGNPELGQGISHSLYDIAKPK